MNIPAFIETLAKNRSPKEIKQFVNGFICFSCIMGFFLLFDLFTLTHGMRFLFQAIMNAIVLVGCLLGVRLFRAVAKRQRELGIPGA